MKKIQFNELTAEYPYQLSNWVTRESELDSIKADFKRYKDEKYAVVVARRGDFGIEFAMFTKGLRVKPSFGYERKPEPQRRETWKMEL